MCKVKTGKAIRTNRDVQNLITSVILRQRSDFNKNGIMIQMRNKMRDTEMDIEDIQVEQMVMNTLGVLECSGVVDKRNGIYKKKKVMFG